MTSRLLGALRPDGKPVLVHVHDHNGAGLCGSVPYPGFTPEAPREGESYPACPDCLGIYMDQVREGWERLSASLDEERQTLRVALVALQDLDLDNPLERTMMKINLAIMVLNLPAEGAEDEVETDG